ncbi:MAG TPA: Wzz/FepE/Etk N-terminal domain-containing protein [Burkholderiales bacterium]
MTDPGSRHLSDYLDILRRRKKQVLGVAAAVFVVSAAAAFLLPSMYRSTATILIEQQEVPRDMLQSTVTGYANQRLQVIQTRVLNRENLMQLAEKFNLYPSDLEPKAEGGAIARIRSNIEIKPVSANVTDPQSGASSLATIAFTVSYDSESPVVARRVADALTDLFLKENQRIRTQKAVQTSGFLGDEEEKLSRRVGELEARVAAYKERNTGRLPELMSLNMSLMERTQRELEDTERQVTSLEQRKLELQAQFANVEPYTGKSPAARLKELQTQYLSAAANYSPDHPDVNRLRREVQSLKRELGVIDERSVVEGEYKKTRALLESAEKQYAPGHPDVARLRGAVADLERKLKQADDSSQLALRLKPDNPAHIALQTQLDTVELSLKGARGQRAEARRKLTEYETRLVQTPRVEQEGLGLLREYDTAVKKYREVKQNLMSAELAVQMEKEQKGERYSILEAAQLPIAPHFPNRRAFLLLGIVLGLGSGVGYASLAEYMDRTVRGAKMVAQVTGALPLAVIPDLAREKVA